MTSILRSPKYVSRVEVVRYELETALQPPTANNPQRKSNYRILVSTMSDLRITDFFNSTLDFEWHIEHSTASPAGYTNEAIDPNLYVGSFLNRMIVLYNSINILNATIFDQLSNINQLFFQKQYMESYGTTQFICRDTGNAAEINEFATVTNAIKGIPTISSSTITIPNLHASDPTKNNFLALSSRNANFNSVLGARLTYIAAFY